MNKAIIFLHVTFLLSNKILVVFNISSSDSNTKLQVRRFSQEQFLMFKYDEYNEYI